MGIICEPSVGTSLATRSFRKQGGLEEQLHRPSLKGCLEFNGACPAAAESSCLTREELEGVADNRSQPGCSAQSNLLSTINESSTSSIAGSSNSSWTTWHSSAGIDEQQALSKPSSSSSSAVQHHHHQQLEEIRPERERAENNWHDLLAADHDLSLTSVTELETRAASALLSSLTSDPQLQSAKAQFPFSWDHSRPAKFATPQNYNYFMQGEQGGGTFGSTSVFRPASEDFLLRHHDLSSHQHQALFFSEPQQQQQHQFSFSSDAIHGNMFSGSTSSASAAINHPKSNLELLLGSSAFEPKQPHIKPVEQGSTWSSWSTGFGLEDGFAPKLNFPEAGPVQSIWPGQSTRKSGKKTEEASKKCLVQETNRDPKRLKSSYSTPKTKYGLSKRSSHKREPALNTNLKPRAKQGCANDPQSIAARQRRERISDRLKILQELIPNGSKVDLVTMLEKAINYVKFLQLQVKVLMNDEYWPKREDEEPQERPEAQL